MSRWHVVWQPLPPVSEWMLTCGVKHFEQSAGLKRCFTIMVQSYKQGKGEGRWHHNPTFSNSFSISLNLIPFTVILVASNTPEYMRWYLLGWNDLVEDPPNLCKMIPPIFYWMLATLMLWLVIQCHYQLNIMLIVKPQRQPHSATSMAVDPCLFTHDYDRWW